MNLLSLYTKADRMYKKIRLYRQNKKKDLKDYHEQEFKIPKQESNDEIASASATTDKEKRLAKQLD